MLLRSGRYRYTPRPGPTLATVAGLALLVSLGVWQLERGAEKADLERELARRQSLAPHVITGEERDPGALAGTPLRASGRYDGARQFLLDNRTRRGVAGYHVLTPLRLGDGAGLLVNRGWIPAQADRRLKPDVRIGTAPVAVSGIGALPRSDQIVLGETGYAGDDGWPRIVQRVELGEMARLLGYELAPVVLRLAADEPGGYVREWSAYVGIGPDRHYGYAFQWFALAAALAAIHFVLSVRRVDERA